MSTLPPELQFGTSADYSGSQAIIPESSRRIGYPPPVVGQTGAGPLPSHHQWEGGPAMTRNNLLYLVVGALVVAVGVLGYQLYQDHKKPEGVNINLGPGGISIEKK
jgi:hypothetical protein